MRATTTQQLPLIFDQREKRFVIKLLMGMLLEGEKREREKERTQLAYAGKQGVLQTVSSWQVERAVHLFAYPTTIGGDPSRFLLLFIIYSFLSFFFWYRSREEEQNCLAS